MEELNTENKQNVDVKKSRFSDAPWFDSEMIQQFPLVIGGAGGIGSWSSLLLSRVGFPIFLYDDDIVEEVNIAGQFYSPTHVGMGKVGAVKAGIELYCGNVDITTEKKRVEKDDVMLTDIMIACFDNMEARKVMFDEWLNAVEGGLIDASKALFIDGRMEAEIAQVFYITPDKAEKYMKEALFDDAQVPDLNCSYKATSHNGAIIGGYITTGVLNHVANIRYNSKFRDVPYCIEYELPILRHTKIKE